MKVEELRPRNPVPSPPAAQCQGECGQYRSKWDRRKFAERGWELEKCSNGASVKIDGVGYCRQHGGSVALQMLIEAGRVEKVGEPK